VSFLFCCIYFCTSLFFLIGSDAIPVHVCVWMLGGLPLFSLRFYTAPIYVNVCLYLYVCLCPDCCPPLLDQCDDDDYFYYAGNILTPIACHMFCNSMGLPSFNLQHPRKIGLSLYLCLCLSLHGFIRTIVWVSYAP